jgi:hypothetical protein
VGLSVAGIALPASTIAEPIATSRIEAIARLVVISMSVKARRIERGERLFISSPSPFR